MPYQRRKRAPRRAPSKQTDKRIRKVVKSELKKEIEMKYFDYQSTGNFGNTLVATHPLTGFVRGTGTSNFIGSSIKIHKIEIRGQLLGVDTGYNVARMVIIQDGPVSGTPTTSTMFQNTTYPWYSPFQADYMDTYRVLKDKTWVLGNDGVTTSSYIPRQFKFTIKGKSLRQVKFSSAGSYDAGAIWINFVSDSVVAANPTWIYTSRVWYTDA